MTKYFIEYTATYDDTWHQLTEEGGHAGPQTVMLTDFEEACARAKKLVSSCHIAARVITVEAVYSQRWHVEEWRAPR